MVSFSVRGVTRRYCDVTGPISMRQAIFYNNVPPRSSLRARLQSLARHQFGGSVTECTYGWKMAFEQIWSQVRVRIQLNPDADVPAETINTLRSTWRTGIEATWSNRWAVGRPGECSCPLQFEVVWATTY